MPSFNHAFVSAVADDADTSTISPSNWNANIVTSLVATDVLDGFGRYVLPGTDRLTIASTSRLRIGEYPVAFAGTYAISPTINDGNYLLQYKRAILAGTARASVFASGELFIFNLAPVGRLVLAGGPS